MDVETDIHLLRSGYLRQNLTGDLHEVQLPLRVFGLAGDPGDRVRKPPVGIARWQVVGIRRIERLGRSFRFTLLQQLPKRLFGFLRAHDLLIGVTNGLHPAFKRIGVQLAVELRSVVSKVLPFYGPRRLLASSLASKGPIVGPLIQTALYGMALLVITRIFVSRRVDIERHDLLD